MGLQHSILWRVVALLLLAVGVPATVSLVAIGVDRDQDEELRQRAAERLRELGQEGQRARQAVAEEVGEDMRLRAKQHAVTAFQRLQSTVDALEQDLALLSGSDAVRTLLSDEDAQSRLAARRQVQQSLIPLLLDCVGNSAMLVDAEGRELSRVASRITIPGQDNVDRANASLEEGESDWFDGASRDFARGLAVHSGFYLDHDVASRAPLGHPTRDARLAWYVVAQVRESEEGIWSAFAGEQRGMLALVVPLSFLDDFRREMEAGGGRIDFLDTRGQILALAPGEEHIAIADRTSNFSSTRSREDGSAATRFRVAFAAHEPTIANRVDRIAGAGASQLAAMEAFDASWNDLGAKRQVRGRRLMVLLALGFLAAFALALWTGRRFTRRVDHLVSATRAFAQGRREAMPASVFRPDEIGLLAAEFEAMGAAIEDRDRQLAGHAHQLEGQVAERTAELVAARDRAEELASEKARFLASMSHELRTPLHGVLGLTELASARAKGDAELMELLGEQRACGDHLLGIINDILDLSKLEAGGMSFERVPFALRRITEGTLTSLVRKAKDNGLSFESHFDAGLPERVLSDPTRLRQALVNLVGNAIKFTERGGITLRVIPGPEVQGTETWVRFEVQDTGVGIPEEALERVFREFGQADETTTRRFGGTGLGLSITSRLVRAMGGRIGLSSEVGRGSVFWFELPLEAAEEVEGEGHSLPPIVCERSLRVLVVDDNPVNRRIAEGVLRADGHTVRMVASGEEALSMATEGWADAVLLDLQMPGLDGFEVARAWRALPSDASGVPLIALTGEASDEARAATKAAGMDAHLAKPYRAEDLRALLQRCDRERLRTSSEATP